MSASNKSKVVKLWCVFTRSFCCSVGHAFIVFSVSCKTKDSVMRQDSEHALSVLKSNSFVLKWKRVVSVLSPLSLFSCRGSQIVHGRRHLGIYLATWRCLRDVSEFNQNG